MERLVFGWDFEVDAWSKFWNLIKICVRTCDMISTLGSVVPLAMFTQGALLIRANQGHSISTVEVLEMLLLCQNRKFFWFQCCSCDEVVDNSFGDKQNDNSGWTGGGCGSISNTCCNSRNIPQVKKRLFQFDQRWNRVAERFHYHDRNWDAIKTGGLSRMTRWKTKKA